MKKTIIIILLAVLLIAAAPHQTPEQLFKLIFIHHSCGENWLADDNGGLGLALAESNYFVSDTYYGWGPDSIGDATDIPNWLDWFVGENSPRYLTALYNENQPATSYSRPLADPGGENEIILFKSCFPNSALEGDINDAPNSDGWLTIGNSKYIYNTLLEYFITRPDKLFVAITAPPLSNSTYAANARAFNDWLVNDWLVNYPLDNVAVFDFHAVLTGPNNRHRLVNGHVEHVTEPGMNTLYYPSDDDHPDSRGNRKATGEFVPLLDYYIERWQAWDTSASPVSEPAPAAETDAQPEAASPAMSASNLIDGFEGNVPYIWEAFHEDAETSMACAPSADLSHSGVNALRLDYSISPYAWGTCHLEFEASQNWSSAEGISFYAYAKQDVTPFHVDLFVDGESYVYEGWVEGSDSWQEFIVFWDEFLRVEWEENAGAPFAKPEQVTALAFGFAGDDETISGTLYIDDLALGVPVSMDEQPAQQPSSETVENESEPAAEENPSPAPLPCVGGLVLPLGLAGLAFRKQKM